MMGAQKVSTHMIRENIHSSSFAKAIPFTGSTALHAAQIAYQLAVQEHPQVVISEKVVFHGAYIGSRDREIKGCLHTSSSFAKAIPIP